MQIKWIIHWAATLLKNSVALFLIPSKIDHLKLITTKIDIFLALNRLGRQQYLAHGCYIAQKKT